MPQSLAQVYLHIVFSTKERRPLLKNREWAGKIHAYLAGICKNQGAPSLLVGGADDHVHLLCFFSRELTISGFLRDIKRDSSKHAKELSPQLDAFGWQDGYGVFSVSPSHVDPLKKYIQNQTVHHRKESFQDELHRLLRKYNVQYDERYIWD